MIKYKHWHTYLLLALLVLALQSCLGIGGNDQFQTKVTTKNGTQVGISSQAMFKGNIYFTLDHNLYVLSGSGTPHQLTQNMDVQDPAVSPDGKLVAFIARYKDYSDLAYMPSSGGQPTILEHGDGQYLPNPGFPPRSTHRWFAQPSWAS